MVISVNNRGWATARVTHRTTNHTGTTVAESDTISLMAKLGFGCGDEVRCIVVRNSQDSADWFAIDAQRHDVVQDGSVPWTLVANISAAVTDALQKIVRAEAVEHQLPATWSVPPSEALDLPNAAELRAALRASGIEEKVQWLLVSEAAKGTAERNKEKFYYNDAMMFLLREQIGADPTKLSEIAEEKNVTTSDLARVLVGSKLMDMVIGRSTDSDFSPDFDALAAEEGYAQSELANREAIAVEAVKIAGEQAATKSYSLTAMQCVSRKFGGSGGAARYAADQFAAGKRGESALAADLKAYGIEDHHFRTEEQQVLEAEEAGQEPPLATPDILFAEPQHIMGLEVRWIDAKNSAIIPGVSDEQKVEKLRMQSAKYVKRFGPGAFLWTKCGFPENLVDEVGDGVVHFRRTVARSYFRTTRCKYFYNGFCRYGDGCTFAHGEEQIRESVDDCAEDEVTPGSFYRPGAFSRARKMSSGARAGA